MKSKKILKIWLLVLFIHLCLVFAGCGTKGPPLPPVIKGQNISAPFDLKHTPVKNVKNVITLSWNHKTDKETAAIKPEVFDIYMAKKTFKECTNCPFKFNKIGSVPIYTREFVFELKKGFKYYFRVQAVGEDNMKSKYSKTVQIDNE
jgi:predicted small lipoprotein YifL